MATISPRSSITASARKGFRSVLSLPVDSLTTIGRWVKDHIEALVFGDIADSDVEALAKQIGVHPAEIANALSLSMTVLMNSDHPGISREWNAPEPLGLEDLRSSLNVLLAPVDIPHDDLIKLRQNSFASRSVIPTLSDVDVLCDLRAIFRSFPSGNPSEKHRTGIQTLLGFEPVAIVSLELNDASGGDHPAIFQVSESGLRNLLKTLEEGLAQIEIIKKELPRLSPKN